jgi:hypothetical protein
MRITFSSFFVHFLVGFTWHDIPGKAETHARRPKLVGSCEQGALDDGGHELCLRPCPA